jgi:NAD(P)-dependent dehydrogenase (short-subunit alcohol dehydrogenase family)
MLNHKVALVTGATGGLGSAIANRLTIKGAQVHLTGRNTIKLEKLLRLNDSYIGSTTVDLRDTAQIKELIDTVKPDILVNCAGIFPVKGIDNTSEEIFNETFEINVRAPFVLTKHASQYMKKKRWGRIINIASSSAYAGFSNTSVYCASKHALLGFSRSAYHELKNYGVRVYCFSPGSIKTEMGRLVEGQDYDTFMEPDEIAKCIVDTISYNGNMISEEIRLNRIFVQ